ncbi:hypothetical protein JXQ70_12310 [bacterium]|nr:hypothetical protein [bacterium]
MVRKVGLIFWCVLLVTISVEGARWFPLEDGRTVVEEPQISILSSGFSNVHYEISIPGLSIQSERTKGGDFDVLSVPGHQHTAQIAAAKLPLLRILTEVPYGAELSVSLDRTRYQEYTLAELGLTKIIKPVQEPILKTADGYKKWRFSRDAKYYATDAFMPEERVTLGRDEFYRAHRVVQVDVCPISYNPVKAKVRIYPYLVFDLTWLGGDVAGTRAAIARTWSTTFEEYYRSIFINYGQFESGISNPKSNYWEGLLVISDPSFFAIADQLVQWREKMGYYVQHVDTTQTGTSAAEVKAYIQQQYDTWMEPPLSFVFLVGDVQHIATPPGEFCGGCASDSDYACVSGGDNVHDLYVGRASVTSQEEASQVFSRFIAYAKADFTRTDWIKKACFASSCDDLYNAYLTHEVCLQNYTGPQGYSGTYYPPPTDPGGDLIRCIEDYNYDGEASGDNMINAILEGRSLVTYSGHGGSTGWSGPSMDISDLQNMEPGEMAPFMAGHCCSAHPIDIPTCMGEACLRELAIGYYGSSSSSGWGEDDYLQLAWFKQIFMNGQNRLGVFTTNGMIDFYNNYSMSDYYMDMELLGGDPTMELYTEIPANLEVTHPEALTVGQSTLTVTVAQDGVPFQNARVSIRKEDPFEQSHAFALTDATGTAYITLSPVPATPGFLEVTVSAVNTKAYEGSIVIVPTTGPWNIHQAHSFIDNLGNGDGILNPGETVTMPVILKNVGLELGTGIQGTLVTDSSFCQIMDSAAIFPEISPSGTGQSFPDHYQFTLGNGTPDGQKIDFTLNWTATGGYSGSTMWSDTVFAPILVLEQRRVFDTGIGNGNGRLDAGETAYIVITLKNEGGCAATGVRGMLSTESEYVTISEPEAFWPEISVGGSAQSEAPHFQVDVTADTPANQLVHFQLILFSNSVCEFSANFDLVIGSRGTVLVIDDSSTGSASLIGSTLSAVGYYVMSEEAASSEPDTWPNYDFIVHASGTNPTPVADHINNLINYVNAGGRLLLEGGEVFHDHSGNVAFCNEVMHCHDWGNNRSGNITISEPEHPLVTQPHILPETIEYNYAAYYDQDSGYALSDALAVSSWTIYPGRASLIAFDNDQDLTNGGQIVFCLFNMTNVTTTDDTREQLIENIASWLCDSSIQSVPVLTPFGIVVLISCLSLIIWFIPRPFGQRP